MKSIVCTKYGPPEVLQLADVAKPGPKEDEVCVRIRATAVTVSDCIIRSFSVPVAFWLPMAFAIGFTRPRKPILGMVFAGEVDSAGESVKSFKTGEKVFGFDRFGFGTYAEYKCLSERGLLAGMPANLNYKEAAAVLYGGLLAVAFLGKAHIQRGSKVLIYGASGSVGTGLSPVSWTGQYATRSPSSTHFRGVSKCQPLSESRSTARYARPFFRPPPL